MSPLSLYCLNTSTPPRLHTSTPQPPNPSMGVTCGCVREPGSLMLPFGVGCVGFSTSSKNPHTPPEWVGTLLRACFAVRKQSPPQVKPVDPPQPPAPQRSNAPTLPLLGQKRPHPILKPVIDRSCPIGTRQHIRNRTAMPRSPLHQPHTGRIRWRINRIG